MTICIAALCENSKFAVIATDHMVTASFLALEFEHPESKVDLLTQTCVGLTAGDALANTELFRCCRRNVNQLSSPTIEIIAAEVKDQFARLRLRKAEEVILQPRGLTCKNFYVDGLMKSMPAEMVFGIDRDISGMKYPVEIIVVGVDETGSHIYGINDPGTVEIYDKLGYHAIGSGSRHALYTIIDGNHSRKRALNETIFLIYEAKRRAELAPGVGKTTEIAIITPGGVKLLTQTEKNNLKIIYERKVDPQIKEFKKEISKLSFGEQKKQNED